jgi:uncharacterized membrane protein
MGSRRRTRKTARIAGKHDEAVNPDRSSALEENVPVIKRWEKTILLARTKAEQVGDWIVCTAGSSPFFALGVVWFGVWVTVNAGAVRGIRLFVPFPFPFVTTTVSLEAIFLALFVPAEDDCAPRPCRCPSGR